MLLISIVLSINRSFQVSMRQSTPKFAGCDRVIEDQAHHGAGQADLILHPSGVAENVKNLSLPQVKNLAGGFGLYDTGSF